MSTTRELPYIYIGSYPVTCDSFTGPRLTQHSAVVPRGPSLPIFRLTLGRTRWVTARQVHVGIQGSGNNWK